MRWIVFDGSFDGLLTAIFDVFANRFESVRLTSSTPPGSLFAEPYHSLPDKEKSARVWKAVQRYLPAEGLHQLQAAFLCEQPEIADHIYQYIRYAVTTKTDVHSDYAHPSVLAVHQWAKKAHREKHRMEAFVRFQLTRDQLYYALIEPDFNVLPLLRPHFERRYADQRWLIYDLRRRYGIYYDLSKVTPVIVDFSEACGPRHTQEILHEDEQLFQQLWKEYFKSTNIPLRKNMRLHLQHMPRRYWKYLTEKQPAME